MYLYSQWDILNVPRMAASLTFYTIFALAPLAAIFLAIMGFVFGSDTARDHLVEAVHYQLGPTGAAVIHSLIEAVSSRKMGTLAALFGLAAMFFGATSVFIDLKNSLDLLWNISYNGPGGLGDIMRGRLVSFAMVLVTGVVLVLFTFVSVSLSAVENHFGNWIPSRGVQALDLILSFGVTTVLFSLIYRVVPSEPMPWRPTLLGATITALLFTAGKAAISSYIGTVGIGSLYGAAGSLFALSIWLYYSSQIVLIGAIITRSRARTDRIGEARRRESIIPAIQYPS